MSLKSQGTTIKGVTYLHVKNRPFFDSNRKLKNTWLKSGRGIFAAYMLFINFCKHLLELLTLHKLDFLK